MSPSRSSRSVLVVASVFVSIVATEALGQATYRVSENRLGQEANQDSEPGNHRFMSADGRYIAYSSLANNLDPDHSDANGTWDVFVHDRVLLDTKLMSVNLSRTAGNRQSRGPSISADGIGAHPCTDCRSSRN